MSEKQHRASSEDLLGFLDTLEEISTSKPSSEPRKRSPMADPLIREFLQQAELLITEHRGLTSKCRVLVDELAADMGLSSQQREIAWQRLTNGDQGGETEATVTPQRKQFFDYLTRRFSSNSETTLNAADENALVQTAMADYFLDRESACEMIRDVREQTGVEYTSLAEAIRVVHAEFKNALSADQTLSRHQRASIIEEGQRLGLTVQQVEEIEQECLREQRARNDSRDVRRGRSRTFIAWAIVGVGLIVAVFSLNRSTDRTAEVASPELPVFSTHAWWDRSLMLDVHDARKELPQLGDFFDTIDRGDEDQRLASYAAWFVTDAESNQSAPAWVLQCGPNQLERIADVVAGLIATEPSETCAERLADSVVALLAPVAPNDQTNPAVYAVAPWAARVLLLTQIRRNASIPRQLYVLRRMSQELDYAFRVGEPIDDVATKSWEEVMFRRFAALQSLANRDPEELWQIYQKVVPAETDTMDDGTADQCVSLLCRYIENADSNWSVWKSVMRETMFNADEQQLDRLEGSANRCRNASLKRELDRMIINARS